MVQRRCQGHRDYGGRQMSLLARGLRTVAEISDHGLLGKIVTEPALNRLADRLEGDDE